MVIKKNLIWLGMIVIVLVGAGLFLNSEDLKQNLDDSNANLDSFISSGEMQVVKMYVEGSKYIFEPSSVQKDVPVRLVADMTRMPSCSKSVISSELGIRKTFTLKDNSVDFVPRTSGSFYIACSMNMYSGYLEVLDSDGGRSGYVQAAPTSGGTCGMNGGSGGCGCGG